MKIKPVLIILILLCSVLPVFPAKAADYFGDSVISSSDVTNPNNLLANDGSVARFTADDAYVVIDFGADFIDATVISLEQVSGGGVYIDGLISVFLSNSSDSGWVQITQENVEVPWHYVMPYKYDTSVSGYYRYMKVMLYCSYAGSFSFDFDVVWYDDSITMVYEDSGVYYGYRVTEYSDWNYVSDERYSVMAPTNALGEVNLSVNYFVRVVNTGDDPDNKIIIEFENVVNATFLEYYVQVGSSQGTLYVYASEDNVDYALIDTLDDIHAAGWYGQNVSASIKYVLVNCTEYSQNWVYVWGVRVTGEAIVEPELEPIPNMPYYVFSNYTYEEGEPLIELTEYYNTGDDSWAGDCSSFWSAQTFTTDSSFTITSVKLKRFRAGNPGTLTISIRATDVNGKPTGGDLTSGTTNADLFTTNTAGEWYEIALTEYELDASTKYAIVSRCPGASYPTLSGWRYDNTASSYGGGDYVDSTNSGSTWTVYAGKDLMFEVYGEFEGEPVWNCSLWFVDGVDTYLINTNDEFLTYTIPTAPHDCAVQDYDGNFHVIWDYMLLYCYYSNSTDGGETWSEPLLIQYGEGLDIYPFDLAVDSGNNLHIVGETDASGELIWIKLDTDRVVEDYYVWDNSEPGDADICVDLSGDYHIAYYDYDEGSLQYVYDESVYFVDSGEYDYPFIGILESGDILIEAVQSGYLWAYVGKLDSWDAAIYPETADAIPQYDSMIYGDVVYTLYLNSTMEPAYVGIHYISYTLSGGFGVAEFVEDFTEDDLRDFALTYNDTASKTVSIIGNYEDIYKYVRNSWDGTLDRENENLIQLNALWAPTLYDYVAPPEPSALMAPHVFWNNTEEFSSLYFSTGRNNTHLIANYSSSYMIAIGDIISLNNRALTRDSNGVYHVVYSVGVEGVESYYGYSVDDGVTWTVSDLGLNALVWDTCMNDNDEIHFTYVAYNDTHELLYEGCITYPTPTVDSTLIATFADENNEYFSDANICGYGNTNHVIYAWGDNENNYLSYWNSTEQENMDLLNTVYSLGNIGIESLSNGYQAVTYDYSDESEDYVYYSYGVNGVFTEPALISGEEEYHSYNSNNLICYGTTVMVSYVDRNDDFGNSTLRYISAAYNGAWSSPETVFDYTETEQYDGFMLSWNLTSSKPVGILWTDTPSTIKAYASNRNSWENTLDHNDPYLITFSVIIYDEMAPPEEPEIPPELDEYGIANMEGCGAWVFEGNTKYDFYITALTSTPNNTVAGLGFYDGANRFYTMLWNENTQTLSTTTPSNAVSIAILSVEETVDHLEVHWHVMFHNEIADVLNATLYTFVGLSSDLIAWNATTLNYFSIYNIGGYASYQSSGDAGRLTGGDAFELWAEDAASWSYADLTYKYLQHVHFLFSWDTGNVTYSWPASPSYLVCPSSDHAYAGTVEYGIYVCYNDTWIQELSVRLDVADGDVDDHYTSPNTSWVRIRVRWYHLGELIKTDYLTTYHNGIHPIQDDTFMEDTSMRFWVDLWFNKINASTTMGGRVNAYMAGMGSGGWWIWGDYYPIYGNMTQSMCFTTIQDEEENTISAKELKMMKAYANVTKLDCDDLWQLKDYDVLTFSFARSSMEGIDTPSSEFQPTQDPTLPVGGLLGGLSGVFQTLAKNIAYSMTFGALAFAGLFAESIDFLAGLFGVTNFTDMLLASITGMTAYVALASGWITTLFGYVFGFLTGFFVNLWIALDATLWRWSQMWTLLLSLFTGTYSGAVDLWSYFGLSEFLIIFIIMMPFLYYEGLVKSGSPLRTLWGDLHSLVDFFSTVIGFLSNVVSMIIEAVHAAIEAIPIVE